MFNLLLLFEFFYHLFKKKKLKPNNNKIYIKKNKFNSQSKIPLKNQKLQAIIQKKWLKNASIVPNKPYKIFEQ